MGFERLQLALNDLDAAGLRRELREVEGPQGRLLAHRGRDYLNFSSNNYLGLAEHPVLRAALRSASEEWGLGSGASRLVTGSQSPVHRLEAALAEFKGTEAALVFNSGYHANLGALSCLVGEGDVIFSDALNHASMIDGMRLGRAKKVVYRHNDMADLRERLRAERATAAPRAQFLIATETVFSMDGDLAPLEELLALAKEFEAWLYLDEAHATGVFGAKGAGLYEAVAHQWRGEERVIQMGTLGKALGCFGAYVAAPRVVVDYLVNRARPFIYTTALPPALAAAALEALRLCVAEPERRAQLQARMTQFHAGLTRLFPDSAPRVVSPIVPLRTGDSSRALALSRALAEQGLWVTAIRPPTVPEGTARLRVTLMATHTEADLQGLCHALERSWPR
ncbi:MAG: 8-amino-7-oxononanoate synthase [bacterium]